MGREPGCLWDTMLVVAEHNHRRAIVVLLGRRGISLGRGLGPIWGGVWRLLHCVFASRNDEGGRSPLGGCAGLALRSLRIRRLGLVGSWLLHTSSSSRQLQRVAEREHDRMLTIGL